jgi:hypothetical protein
VSTTAVSGSMTLASDGSRVKLGAYCHPASMQHGDMLSVPVTLVLLGTVARHRRAVRWLVGADILNWCHAHEWFSRAHLRSCEGRVCVAL